jgi:hypothetical protein
MLTGCFAKHIAFEPTNSPCLDALTANFAYAKCQEIEESGSWGEQLKISCLNPQKKTEWTTREYYVITSLWGGYAPEDAIPLCADDGLFILYKNGVGY